MPRFRNSTALQLTLILAASTAAGWALWTKLFSLIWLDPPLWLQNAFRFTNGEMPYRDYSYPYPPLAIAIFGWAFRWLGVDFTVAQLVMDVLSLGIVLAAYALVRQLLPRALHALACILLIAVCATSQTYFSLFSLLGYSPSLQVAALGLLLVILGAFRYLDQGVWTGNVWIMAVGAAISMLSKQEPMLAVPGILAILAVCDRGIWFRDRSTGEWARTYAGVASVCLIPSAVALLLLTARAGVHNFASAMRGYGLATIPCPWWPTGLGVVSAFAAIGAALALGGIASRFESNLWKSRMGGMYSGFVALSFAGLCGYLIFEWNIAWQVLNGGESVRKQMAQLAAEVLSTRSVLRPALWVVLPYWIFLLIQGWRSRRVSAGDTKLLLLLAVPSLIGIRSLFGNTLTVVSEVPALSVPFLLIIGPYLLLRFLETPHGEAKSLRLEGHRIPVAIVGALAAFYILVRVVGGYSSTLSDREYTKLDTAAGSVLVQDGSIDRPIYDYVMANTVKSDTILELPYGGGMSVATGRRMPTFTTHFAGGFTMEPGYQAMDLEKFKASPPAVVIAKDELHYGAYDGIKGTMGCSFPRLVWEPDTPSWDPQSVLPMVDYVERNYHVDRKVGGWLLLRPN